MIDLNFTKLQIVFDPRWRRCTMTWFDWGRKSWLSRAMMAKQRSSLTSHRRSGVDRRMVQQTEAAARWVQPPHNAIYKLTRAVEVDFFTFMPPQARQQEPNARAKDQENSGKIFTLLPRWSWNLKLNWQLISAGPCVHVWRDVLDTNHL